MPGPVSDSYDPEFGTGANADEVASGIDGVVKRIDKYLGPQLHNIVDVVRRSDDQLKHLRFTERELRIIRFCLNRAKESI